VVPTIFESFGEVFLCNLVVPTIFELGSRVSYAELTISSSADVIVLSIVIMLQLRFKGRLLVADA